MKNTEKIEWFPVVDESGNEIARAPRHQCHDGKSKLLHPVIHIHIFNEKGELFLQKRAMTKDILPGKWDTSVGGHIGPGESVEEALKREAEEELGIKIDPDKLIDISRYVFESDIEKEYVFSFIYKYNGEVVFQESEIDEIKYYKKDEIYNLIKSKYATPNFEKEFNLLIEKGVL